MNWLGRINQWFHLVVDKRPPLRSSRVDDLPEILEREIVYLVGDGRKPWSASLICPCGCGEIISLSLITNDDPRWRATSHWNGTVTIHPSIWRTKGCKSHFFIRRGKIVWAKVELEVSTAKMTRLPKSHP